MITNSYFTRPWVLRRYSVGPVAPYLTLFSKFLAKQGYPYKTGQLYVREVGHLSRWLYNRKINIEAVNEEIIKAYLRSRKRGKPSRAQRVPHALLFNCLRQNSIIKAPVALNTPLNDCLNQYREHMTKNQGLTKETIRGRTRIARHFLTYQFENGVLKYSKIQPRDIEQYLIKRSCQCNGMGIKVITSALRCFLRFLQFQGKIPSEIVDCVPKIPSWKDSGIPGFLTTEEISLLLQNCKCDTSKGLRDKAIILLLIRLGLRAIEICRLALDDIDWHDGFIIVSGKNGKKELLPLLQDVGEAISTYLRCGRPRCSSRYIFIRAVAPFESFSSSSAIAGVVRNALNRAGLWLC